MGTCRTMGRLSRRAFAVAALSAAHDGRGRGAPAAADGGRRAATEMRGMWLATVANRDWPSKPGLTAAAAARRAARPPRHGGRPPAQRGVLPGAADRRRPVALPVRALVAVPDRHPGQGPGLGPARHGGRARPTRAVCELHAWFNPYRVANHTDPVPARRLPPRPPAPGLGGAVRREALLQPRAARGPRLRPGRDARRGAAVPRGRRALRRLLLPVSGGRPELRRRRGLRRVRRRLPEPGRLAAGQHRQAGAARRPPGSRTVTAGRPASASAPSGCGATPPPTRAARTPGPACRRTTTCTRTPASGCARAGSTTSCPQLYWNIGFAAADYAEARALVGARSRRAPGRSSTSARPSTRRATRRSPRPGRTRPSCPATSPSPAATRRCAGMSSSPRRRWRTDRIGAMARVVADHYRAAGGVRRAAVYGSGRLRSSWCRITVSGPGDTLPSCPSSKRTRYGGCRPWPRLRRSRRPGRAARRPCRAGQAGRPLVARIWGLLRVRSSGPWPRVYGRERWQVPCAPLSRAPAG